MEAKKDIRKKVFEARKNTSDQQILDWSADICNQVTNHPLYQSADKIYIYVDYNREVKTDGIIKKAWADGKQVAVPKVNGKLMDFYELTDFSQLEEGYFHIPEPATGTIVNWEDALMIMPGVAFDTEHHRVGYGGGFYDRHLEKHTGHSTMAICFEFQVLENLPYEATDIKPSVIVTEKRILEG